MDKDKTPYDRLEQYTSHDLPYDVRIRRHEGFRFTHLISNKIISEQLTRIAIVTPYVAGTPHLGEDIFKVVVMVESQNLTMLELNVLYTLFWRAECLRYTRAIETSWEHRTWRPPSPDNVTTRLPMRQRWFSRMTIRSRRAKATSQIYSACCACEA